MAIRNYSLSASLNTSISGLDVGENSPAANVNNAIRQIMADLKASVGGVGVGDDTVQTTAVQAGHDILATGNGGVLNFLDGNYRVALNLTSRAVSLRGTGSVSSVIKPASATGVALRATYATADWKSQSISDIGFAGTGTNQGTGFKFGPDTYSANAEYIGRAVFDRCAFINLDKCVERPRGNIGAWFNDCDFSTSNYHIWSRGNDGTDGDPMHVGNMTASRGHWDGAAKASVYLDGASVTGSGQIVFESVIMENNPGWCFFIRNLTGINSSPGIIIKSCWNETNYTAGSVTIEGATVPENVTAAAGWAYLDNVGNVLVEDTPLGPLTMLNGSHVITRACDLSQLNSVTMDEASSLYHEQARIFTGTTKGLVRSVGCIENVSSNSPWFTMGPPKGLAPTTASVISAYDAQAARTWSGGGAPTSTPASSDPGIPWLTYSQDLVIGAGQTTSSTTFTIPGDLADTKFGVLLFIARVTSGAGVSMRVNGNAGFGGAGTIDNAEWRMFANVTYNSSGVDITLEGVYLTNSSGASTTIRIGGYAFVSLSTFQEALALVNSGLFPAPLRKFFGSATYDPASLADGAGATTTVTVTGAVLGDYARATFSLDLQGITLSAWVSAADTVSVRFQNESGGTLDLASGTLRAVVDKA